MTHRRSGQKEKERAVSALDFVTKEGDNAINGGRKCWRRQGVKLLLLELGGRFPLVSR